MLFPELHDLDNFEYIRTIGQGYSANVDLYRHIETNQLVAIKKLSIKTLSQGECRKYYDIELSILTKLQGCSNVVQLLGHGYFTTVDNNGRRPRNINNYFLILEYIECTPLDKSQRNLTQFFYKLLITIQKIHELGVVHRDLNLNNILVHNNEPILIDFTFGAFTNGKQKFSEYYGTKPYVAPEIIDGSAYYPYPSEIYSLGILLQELIQCSETEELVKSMTEQNPFKRPSIQEIIEHPYFHF